LDFGAVDVIWNEKEDKYYVLEVNTACGLEGTTLDKYVEQFRRYV
jgi:D-alanine-D-alanine ligase-like ATP-grasp enzyme